MTNSMYGILFTTLVGVFFLITVLLSKFVSKKKNFLVFLLGFTFSIMIGMVIFSLYPEAKEIFINKKHYNLIILVFTLIGFLFTYFFDKLVPDHHKEGNITFNNNNLIHISLMTSIALIIHNFVEGAGLYTITLSSVKSGFIMFLATVIQLLILLRKHHLEVQHFLLFSFSFYLLFAFQEVFFFLKHPLHNI